MNDHSSTSSTVVVSPSTNNASPTTSSSSSSSSIPLAADLLVKLLFPPTSSIITKTIVIQNHQKVSDVIQYATQLGSLQPGYSLYLIGSSSSSSSTSPSFPSSPYYSSSKRGGQWLDDNSLMSSYPINSSDIIQIKRRPGFIRNNRKNTLATLKGFKEGKVQKLSSYTKIWNTRYLRLYSQRLVHTTSENDTGNSEFISFSDIINVDRDINRKYSFIIYYYSSSSSSSTSSSSTNTSNTNSNRETKEYIFRCRNHAEMDEWVDSIRLMLKKSRPDLFLPPLSPLSSSSSSSSSSIVPNNNIVNISQENHQTTIKEGSPSSTTTIVPLDHSINNNAMSSISSSSSSSSTTTPTTKSRSFSFSALKGKTKKDSNSLGGTAPSSSPLFSTSVTTTTPQKLTVEEELKQIKITLERESKIKLQLEKKYFKLKKKYAIIKKKSNPPPSSSSTAANTIPTTPSSIASSITSILTRSRSFSTPAPVSPQDDSKKKNKLSNDDGELNVKNQDNNTNTNINNNNNNNNNITPTSTPTTPYHYRNGGHGGWTPATSPFAIGSTRIKNMLKGDRRSVDTSSGSSSTLLTGGDFTETLSTMDDDDDDDDSKMVMMVDEIKDLKDQILKLKDKLTGESTKSHQLEQEKKKLEKDIYNFQKIEERKERELSNDIIKYNINLDGLSDIASKMKQSLSTLAHYLQEAEEEEEEVETEEEEEEAYNTISADNHNELDQHDHQEFDNDVVDDTNANNSMMEII